MKKQQLRWRLIAAFRRSYRNKLVASRLYQALAQHEPCQSDQEILLLLARKSEQSATHYAVRLLRLNGALPSDADKLGDRLYCWLLVSCGRQWAMSWLDRKQKGDMHLYALLLTSYHEF